MLDLARGLGVRLVVLVQAQITITFCSAALDWATERVWTDAVPFDDVAFSFLYAEI